MKIMVYVISAILGAVAGAVIMRGVMAPKVAVLTDQVAQLEAKNREWDVRVKKLMKAAEQFEQQPGNVDQPAAEPTPGLEPVEDEPLADLETSEAPDEFAVPNRDPRREWARRGRPQVIGEGEQTGSDSAQQDAENEERRERFREFEQRARERVNTVLQDELLNATDSDTQERIQNIQTYVDELAQLRSEMRNAETDDERTALRQSMWETYNGLQDLVHAQQDSMMRSFAANNGITDTARQDAFIAGLQNLQSNPFFQAERMLGGGWRGGPWGGDFRGGGFFGGNPNRAGRQP